MSALKILDWKIGGMAIVDDGIASLFLPIHLSNHHHSPQLYFHLSYNDLSIYLSTHTFHSTSASLFYHHHHNRIMLTNVNVNPTTTKTKLLSPSSLSNFLLCTGARRILTTPNAGGSSVISEVLSAELLYRLFGATVIKTETEITYCRRGSPITDYACQFKNNNTCITVGISVTRAMSFRRALEKNDVHRLLVKKLKGINISSKTVTNCYFTRQILHVWTQSGHDAAIVKRVWIKLPDILRSNTILLVTTINCPLLFFEKQNDNSKRNLQTKKLGFKKWF